MRMNGSWHLYRHGERWWRGPHAMRVRIDTADWVAVAFNVPVAEFVTPRQLETRDPVAQLGPDLLGVEFDRDEAIRRIVASAARPIAHDAARSAGRCRDWQRLQIRGAVPVRRAPGSAVERGAAAGPRSDDGHRPGACFAITSSRVPRRGSRPIAICASSARRPSTTRACGSTAAATSRAASCVIRPIEMKKMGLEARSTYWCPTCQKNGQPLTVTVGA